jgi:hypothetical protein
VGYGFERVWSGKGWKALEDVGEGVGDLWVSIGWGWGEGGGGKWRNSTDGDNHQCCQLPTNLLLSTDT